MGLVFKEDDNQRLQTRSAIIVWLKKASDQYKLRHYGDIVYFSRKNNYTVLYCDTAKTAKVIADLSKKDFVKKAELSRHNQLNFSPEYETSMMQALKEKAEKLREENEDLRV